MENNVNILDKVISHQISKEKEEFNPADIISKLFSGLSSREAQILRSRFGLDGTEPKTLEAIGKDFNVTRERIRQIEKQSNAKLRELEFFNELLKPVLHLVKRELRLSGGLMKDEDLVNELGLLAGDSHVRKNDVSFIISQLLEGSINEMKHPDAHSGWFLDNSYLAVWQTVIDKAEEYFNTKRRTMNFEKLSQVLHNHPALSEKIKNLVEQSKHEDMAGLSNEDELVGRILNSYLSISKKINSNPFGHWGLVSWVAIMPRRMSDKIYLALKDVGNPQHFEKITSLVNQSKFDAKVAYAPTVHNELILDKRFVLVGRGIYALREWGYEEGVVSQVIAKILQEAAGPLEREAIVEQVLKLRLVKKGTVYLSLNDQTKFTRLSDGRYQLPRQAEEASFNINVDSASN